MGCPDAYGVRTVVPASSQAGDDAIITAAAARLGKVPSKEAREVAKAQLRHAKRVSGERERVFVRTATVGGVIYRDHGPGRVVRIGADGLTLLDDTASGVPLFYRPLGAGTLSDPEWDGDAARALKFLLGDLRDRFGLDPRMGLLVIGVLLAWMDTETPYPILEIVGPAGSGKSTFGDYVSAITDPAGGGERITVGSRVEDIAAAAQQRHLIAIDNAGRLDKATSDALCTVATGGTLLVRMLYSNGETASLRLHSPTVITAVSPVCEAPDLATRVVRVELSPRAGDYVAESELRRQIESSRPKTLGALYTLMSGAMRHLAEVRARLGWDNRMVDLDQLGEAVIAAVGLPSGYFTDAFRRSRERMARRTATGDAFVITLLRLLVKLSEKPAGERPPTPTAIAKADKPACWLMPGGVIGVGARPEVLRKALAGIPSPPGSAEATPRSARALGDALRRVQPSLGGIGVKVGEEASGSRVVLLFEFKPEAIRDE